MGHYCSPRLQRGTCFLRFSHCAIIRFPPKGFPLLGCPGGKRAIKAKLYLPPWQAGRHDERWTNTKISSIGSPGVQWVPSRSFRELMVLLRSCPFPPKNWSRQSFACLGGGGAYKRNRMEEKKPYNEFIFFECFR